MHSGGAPSSWVALVSLSLLVLLPPPRALGGSGRYVHALQSGSAVHAVQHSSTPNEMRRFLFYLIDYKYYSNSSIYLYDPPHSVPMHQIDSSFSIYLYILIFDDVNSRIIFLRYKQGTDN